MAFETYAAECAVCELDGELKKTLCPVCLTQKVVRGKWKIVILWLHRDKKMRFSELKKNISNITQAYLSSQLKDLESDKLVDRKSYNEIPPRVEYSLTEEGKKFIDVINHINNWGYDYITSRMNGMPQD